MIIHRFESLESTNKYCELLDLPSVEEFSVFWAMEQTAGIGQRGNHWSSQSGKNLTFSLVLHPTMLPASRQFLLTQALSLAVVDGLRSCFLRDGHDNLGQSLRIKWPNDIYVGTSKICGILTENRLSTSTITTSICGIGLNVNQTTFEEWIPNPTSLSLLTTRHYDLEETLTIILSAIQYRYGQLKQCLTETIQSEYLSLLLFCGIQRQYLLQGDPVTATIQGVSPQGHLLLLDSQGRHLQCEIKQIQFLL